MSKLLIFTPECYDAFLAGDFKSSCIKSTIASGLNYAIIGGALMVKFPQIGRIMKYSSVTGLSSASFYLETLAFTAMVLYNYIRQYPFTSYGEAIAILIQNYMLIGLLWHYSLPENKPSFVQRAGIIGFYVALVAGLFRLDPKFLFLLPLASTFSSILSRLPQIYENFKNGHTGQLAFLTNFLNLGGSAARLFTTLQGTNDPQILASFGISCILNGILCLQIGYYYQNTDKILAAQEAANPKKID